MAQGFGNAGNLTFAGWTTVTGADARQIGAPGWTRVVADLTPIDQANGILRKKIVSGRLDPKAISVELFYDPASAGTPAPPTAAALLTLTYPTGNTAFAMNASASDWTAGSMIDDEVMIAECEFTLAGGVALDDPTET